MLCGVRLPALIHAHAAVVSLHSCGFAFPPTPSSWPWLAGRKTTRTPCLATVALVLGLGLGRERVWVRVVVARTSLMMMMARTILSTTFRRVR